MDARAIGRRRIPSTTAICRVIACMTAGLSWPMTWPMSDRRTVCSQSTITWNGAHRPFSDSGATSIRKLTPSRSSDAIGSTVAWGRSRSRSERTTTAGLAL
jgi:hypothetical protein